MNRTLPLPGDAARTVAGRTVTITAVSPIIRRDVNTGGAYVLCNTDDSTLIAMAVNMTIDDERGER